MKATKALRFELHLLPERLRAALLLFGLAAALMLARHTLADVLIATGISLRVADGLAGFVFYIGFALAVTSLGLALSSFEPFASHLSRPGASMVWSVASFALILGALLYAFEVNFMIQHVFRPGLPPESAEYDRVLARLLRYGYAAIFAAGLTSVVSFVSAIRFLRRTPAEAPYRTMNYASIGLSVVSALWTVSIVVMWSLALWIRNYFNTHSFRY
jgi:hypothetical protein